MDGLEDNHRQLRLELLISIVTFLVCRDVSLLNLFGPFVELMIQPITFYADLQLSVHFNVVVLGYYSVDSLAWLGLSAFIV